MAQMGPSVLPAEDHLVILSASASAYMYKDIHTERIWKEDQTENIFRDNPFLVQFSRYGLIPVVS